ncbi:hypothetical protein [Streptomyces sp. NPDC058603]|uniref:hypothetical protein n=1 Tax=Streptomyces sp. NPDC058603 TaxID=3346551 RepID=UPI003651199A
MGGTPKLKVRERLDELAAQAAREGDELWRDAWDRARAVVTSALGDTEITTTGYTTSGEEYVDGSGALAIGFYLLARERSEPVAALTRDDVEELAGDWRDFTQPQMKERWTDRLEAIGHRLDNPDDPVMVRWRALCYEHPEPTRTIPTPARTASAMRERPGCDRCCHNTTATTYASESLRTIDHPSGGAGSGCATILRRTTNKRGNSVSGKSSIAVGLHAHFSRNLSLVGQDNLRRIVLRERDRLGRQNSSLRAGRRIPHGGPGHLVRRPVPPDAGRPCSRTPGHLSLTTWTCRSK